MAQTAEEVAAELKEGVVSTVREHVGKFLDENADAKVFLEDRAKRLAELAVALVKVGANEMARKAVMYDISIVRQSMANEISAVAVAASKASRETFRAVLGTAADILVKVAPKLLALL